MPPDEFYATLLCSELVITDSGGVQEECIFHAKKVLVLREVSERRVDFECSELVDPKGATLKEKFDALLSKELHGQHNDYYGNGGAARKIIDVIESRL